MSNKKKESPKVFFSYSWTSEEYQKRILTIATNLIEHGIDVVLDLWDLPEGADVNAYMEKSVTDKTVTKVLIFCDSKYAEKADARAGGVGTETLIITPEIYNQNDVTSKEQRYLPIVMERDHDGNATLPTYLKSRRYIDMSDEECEIDHFDQLVRAIYEKPFLEKPALGKTPAFILSDTVMATGLTSYKTKAVAALKDGKSTAISLCQSYFDAFLEKIESVNVKDCSLHIDSRERFIKLIESMLPLKEECEKLIFVAIKENGTSDFGKILHYFFEKINHLTEWPEGMHSWDQTQADHYRFMLYELMLNSYAYSFKYNKLDIVGCLFEEYYCESIVHGNTMQPFYCLNFTVQSLMNEYGTQSKEQGDLVLKRNQVNSLITKKDIIQADLLLFLKSSFCKTDTFRWWPCTLVYSGGKNFAFEIFARAQASTICGHLFQLLGIKRKSDLENFIYNDDYVRGMAVDGIFAENIAAMCNLNLLETNK